MTKSRFFNLAKRRFLFVLTLLICLFVNAQAQYSVACDEPGGLFENPGALFTNELEGFKFYGKGKLSTLRFGVSSRQDVEKIFGAPVNTTANPVMYDYDSDWSIVFRYFDLNGSRIVSQSYRNGVMLTTVFVPKPDFIGKVDRITLIPKKNVPFGQMNFSNEFNKNPYMVKASAKGIKYYFYKNRFGLTYQVFDHVVGWEGKQPWSQGDLVEIVYAYPCSKDPNIYIEQK